MRVPYVPVDRRIDLLEQMKDLLIAVATGGDASESDYMRLRRALVNEPALSDRLPRFVRDCRSIAEFWNYIKYEFGTYADRRSFIWDAFNPILLEIENRSLCPGDAVCGAVIGRPDRAHVFDQWEKALARRNSDPSGAITAARSLLESVCKSILHEAEREYEDVWTLHRLYKETAELLSLAPSQHSEPVFKQILGGCSSVVAGLGAVRNSDGDAHGAGPLRHRPAARHAQLAVNLAFSTATFLIESWEDRCRSANQHAASGRSAVAVEST